MMMALAIPIARPMMLIAENPLLRQRFLKAILKKFLSMLVSLILLPGNKVAGNKKMLLAGEDCY
jgi:hypothetical protein